MVARSNDITEDLPQGHRPSRGEDVAHDGEEVYGKMRDGAKKNVVEAIPDLAKMIEKNLG